MSCFFFNHKSNSITVEADLTSFAILEPDFRTPLDLLQFYFCVCYYSDGPNHSLSRCILTLLPLLIRGIHTSCDGYGLSSPYFQSFDALCYATGYRYTFRTYRETGIARAYQCNKPHPNLRRHTTSVLGQSLRRYQENLCRDFYDFEKFLRVWLGRNDEIIAARIRKLPMDRDYSMELILMANYFEHLVSSPDIYSCRSLSALAILLESIFGKSGAVDFWRVSSLPVDRYFQDPEDDFQGSVVQAALQQGEGL
ncbi:P0 protein [Plantago asiatica virus A]|uniref:P0 protein n=1 Tax=Plantago asiatica virus A TaxID=2871160 RepID=A0AAE8CET9_9VIRU|nr:P0 protein [Plantago asiatica virus A]